MSKAEERDTDESALPRRRAVPGKLDCGTAAPEYFMTPKLLYLTIYYEALNLIVSLIKDSTERTKQMGDPGDASDDISELLSVLAHHYVGSTEPTVWAHAGEGDCISHAGHLEKMKSKDVDFVHSQVIPSKRNCLKQMFCADVFSFTF
ncbi:hypothetical protein LSAT2_004345 [Lamellibrachia satsuma]|nr:hypothetical protein LSAT2_004345 [Lamellibrachia satsuma]